MEWASNSQGHLVYDAALALRGKTRLEAELNSLTQSVCILYLDVAIYHQVDGSTLEMLH